MAKNNGNAVSELRKNTLIIAIANLGTKAISFVLAPLYSYYLTTSQYGTMDLINTTVSLLIPFFCLDIFEATFRYSNDREYDERKVVSSSIFVCVPGLAIAFIVLLVSAIMGANLEYILYTEAYIALGALIDIFAQYARGHRMMMIFAGTGVVGSISLLVANVVFLVALKLGLRGWLVSFLIARTVTLLFLIVSCKGYRLVSLKYVDKSYLKIFLKFCAPLIPTAAMWWIMNASDRYMIAFFLGASANGIYSVANKLPTILGVFENVFYQAWQTTAISTLDSEERDSFYTSVFNNYLSFLTIGVLGLLLIGRPFIIYLFAKDYSTAWMSLAPLIIGVLVHALAGNLGSLYSVFKDTKGALYSTIVGAITNIGLNIIFIPIFGIIGAALTTLTGYIVTLVYRWFDVRKFVNLTLNRRNTIECILLIILQSCLYYFNNPLSYAIRAMCVMYLMVKNRKMILRMVKR